MNTKDNAIISFCADRKIKLTKEQIKTLLTNAGIRMDHVHSSYRGAKEHNDNLTFGLFFYITSGSRDFIYFLSETGYRQFEWINIPKTSGYMLTS